MLIAMLIVMLGSILICISSIEIFLEALLNLPPQPADSHLADVIFNLGLLAAGGGMIAFLLGLAIGSH